MTRETRQKATRPQKYGDPKTFDFPGKDASPVREEFPAALLSGAGETDEDAVLNISLRPARLSEFIGQKTVVENLKVCLTAARQRKEPLEHVLLSGPPGLGKTCLSHIIAHEMHSKITATSGPAIERAGDLIPPEAIHVHFALTDDPETRVITVAGVG